MGVRLAQRNTNIVTAISVPESGLRQHHPGISHASFITFIPPLERVGKNAQRR